MSTATETRDYLTKIYLGAFLRAPELLGFQYWESEVLDGGKSLTEVGGVIFSIGIVTDIYPAELTDKQFVEAIYHNVFGKVGEPDGIAYWTAEIAQLRAANTSPNAFFEARGQLVFNMIQAGLATPDGTPGKAFIENRLESANDTLNQQEASGVEIDPSDLISVMAQVNDDPVTVARASDEIAALIGEPVFTLTENVIAGETIAVEPITKVITYVGFNSTDLTDDGVDAGGAPLYDIDNLGNPVSYSNEDGTPDPIFAGGGTYVAQKGLISYIRDLTGLDFVQLGLINIANGTDDGLNNGSAGTAPNSSIQVPAAINITAHVPGDNAWVPITVTATNADGTVNTAEAQISDAYFKLLTDLVLDQDGNLRLYEKTLLIYPQQEITVDGVTFNQNIYQYEGESIVVPVILTPTTNNGGTEEAGVTTTGNDLIVAARLELLHGAYIDGGRGVNTLEIDAKGYFAQPKELLNIQHIKIENLPNVYTDENGQNQYPDYSVDTTFINSIIDITRANDLETLTITESDFQGMNHEVLGSLTVTGIRNGAETTLDGSFSQNLFLNFGDLQGNGVDLVLNNVNFGVQGGASANQLVVAHNSNTLNIKSTGGDNYISNANLVGTGEAGGLSTLNISGDAHLYIEGNLDPSFHNGTAAVIDASVNTGGVNLTLKDFADQITFTGTAAADDRFNADNNGKSVIINGGAGDNEFTADAGVVVSITSGDGNNVISAENVTVSASIVAGDGRNDIDASGSKKVTITAGDGGNKINTDGASSVSITTGSGSDSVSAIGSKAVEIDAGNGNNSITVSAEEIAITTGTGNDTVTLVGTGGDITGAGGVGSSGVTAVNLMLVIDNSGSLSAADVQAEKDAANALIDKYVADGLDVAVRFVAFSPADSTFNGSAEAWINVTDAKAVIAALDGSGGTNFDAALTTAIAAWDGAATDKALFNTTGAANQVVFMSDGQASIEQATATAWESFLTTNKITSYAFGFGAGADLTAMEPVAFDGVTGSQIDVVGVTDSQDLLDAILITAGGGINGGASGNDALINIDLGAGQNTIYIGDHVEGLLQGLTAMEGSAITGSNITLFVNTVADLRAAELSGITTVVLDDDRDEQIGFPKANEEGDRALLTLTAAQFAAIGAENFSVDGAIFNTHSQIKIIVEDDISLTGVLVDSLPRNIDLLIEINDGATLTLTAEQLHKWVAPQGITLADDGNTDLASGNVVITGGGLDFDPFNTSDTIKTNIDGNVYFGGSMSEDFMVDGSWYNVSVKSQVNGFDRPADVPAEVVITLDSGTGLGTITQGAFSTWHTNLEIVGEKDIDFSGAIQMGMDKGVATNTFNIDFSQLAADVIDFTVDNFELLAQGGGIYGNSDAGYASVVHVQLAADDHLQGDNGTATNGVGFDEVDADSLVSRGVSKYVVTVIDGPTAQGSTGNTATIKLCDTTQDLEVMALRGNYNDTLNVVDAAWGLVFELQGGSTAKADGPTGTANVGTLVANFEWAGADAVVNLVHSVAGDTRVIKAYGINIDGADSITVDAGVSSAIIDNITGDNLETISAVSTGDIDLGITKAFDTIDGSAVAGTFTLAVTGDIDFSDSTLVDVEAIQLVGDATTLTLTQAQLDAIGAANISGTGTVQIVDLGASPFDSTAFASGIMLEVVVDNTTLTLDPATDLSNVSAFDMNGANLTMTADQLIGLATSLASTGDMDTFFSTMAGAVLNITDVAQAHADWSIEFLGNEFNFTDLLSQISNNTDNVSAGTLSLAESVNLAAPAVFGGADIDFTVLVGAGLTLGLATAELADGLVVEGAVDSVIDMLFTNLGNVDSIDASGFNVSDLRFQDLLVDGENVDEIFQGLLASVEKIIYNNSVKLIDQTVTVSAGSFVRGDLNFSRTEDDLELEDFVLNLMGGTVVEGSVALAYTAKDGELIQTYLKTVTINSTGTTANAVTGDSANIIEGGINASAVAGTPAYFENEMLDITINAEQDLDIQGAVVFTAVANNDEVATLTVNGTADVSIGTLNTADTDVDGLNVVNNGTGTLTVGINAANIGADDDLSFTGTGDIVLTVTGNVDLSDDDLAAVSQVVLSQGATLTLTMAQADAIGAGNFELAAGATAAELNLDGLDGEPFAVANYADGITVAVLSVADLPVVTLHPDTNLSGIGGLLVHEGTVLNMTAEQFQQLGGDFIAGPAGWGTIAGIDGTTNFTVNITNLTQVDVDNDLNGDGVSSNAPGQPWEHLNLTQVFADYKTITLGESVELQSQDNLGGFDVIMGDDMTLTLAEVRQADGLNISGGINTTLKFNDTVVNNPADFIDASGFDVSELHMTAQLAAGQNVDMLFQGLAASITKVITDEYGYVTGTTQTVIIQAGSLVNGDLAFIKADGDIEILDFTLNLQGGTILAGDVNLSTINHDGALIPMHLQTVTINSSGTEANPLNGETANVIQGDLTSQSFGAGYVDNNLLDVTINATQELVIEGNVVFESVTGDDNVTANDDDEAVAELTINGTSDVTIGGIDTSDTDVDGVNIVNNSTGTLSLTITAANTDAMSFTGTGSVALTVTGVVDLSDDVLTAVSQITIADNATLTLSQAQFDAIGAANIVDGDTEGLAILNINGVNAVFDATTIDDDIDVQTLTLAGNMDFAATASNLTGVNSIVVPKGSTLTLSAAQYQQLLGAGTITGVDADGNASTDFTVNITDLTQADIDGGAFVTTGITAENITLALGEDVNLSADDVIENVDILIMADNQTLGLANEIQADRLNVDGGANTTIVFQYAPHTAYPGQIDASGYDVTTLKALAVGFTIGGNSNVEYSIDDLPSSVELRLYADSADLGFLDATYRRVTIEEGITTPTGLIFNDWDDTDEVRTLTLTLEGDVTLNGNLSIPTRTDKDGTYGTTQYFDTLTIVSEGTESNTIAGNINTATVLGAPNTSDNNLLKVVINADQDLNVEGDIVFNSIDVPLDNAVANLTVTGAADVSIQQLNVLDDDIDVLNVANDGTGTLTVTGTSPAIDGDASIETINLSGTGDIVFGVHPDLGVVTEWGISAAGLSTLNATGLSGDLTLGEVRDIDSANFTFTAGTGVTKLTLSADTLDVTEITDIGWNFNFTNAAVGSEFRLGSLTQNAPTFTDGPLSINLGANTTLYIDKDTDFSLIDLTLIQTLPIVLADGVELRLTAEQADGLVIIAGPDTGATGITAQVNIVYLGDAPVDLSGIAANIAGTATLEDNDVTLDAATDLGDFSISLTSLTNTDLSGQTIRFQNVDQAARDVVVSDVAGAGANSSNVVWLFGTVTEPVNTDGYDSDLGRLWISQTLAANSNNIEQLFTSLPDSIVRVEFTSLEEVNFALASAGVDRTIELVSFTDLASTGLVFSDADRYEHVQSLNFKLGGSVNSGDITIDNLIAPSANPLELTPTGIVFDTLTINSERALHQDHYLAPELYVNDNDGLSEEGENVQPVNLNVVGDIAVGTANGLDLLTVVLNTGLVSAIGNGGNTDAQNLALSQGANLQVGTITFDASAANSTATLNVTGFNNTTIASLNTTDADITGLAITNSGAGILTVTGASPAAAVSNTETLTINATGAVVLGTSGDLDKPGVDGSQLSLIDVNGTGDVDLGLIVRIDGVAPVLPATYSFFLDATGNSGDVTAVLGAGTAGAPVLQAGGVWIFDNGATGTLNLTLSDDVTLGAGTLSLDNLTLTIDGDVDFTTLANFIRDVTDVTIVVPATSSLTLTAAQADGLKIVGAGEVFVTALEATPDADLGNIMTNEGDSGTVFATVNTADDADVDLLPELVNLTGDLGIAQVTVIGDGVADVTGATMDATIDRDPTVVVDNEFVMATFVVQAAATLVVTAAQGDERSVTGAGTTNVENIALFAGTNDMSLAGIVTATVNIAVDSNVTLNSADNLGAAGAGRVTTIAANVTLTAAGSVVDGQYIVGENATLRVNDENTLPVETPITANLSNVSAEFITLIAIAEVGTITFPVLYGDPAAKDLDPTVAVQTVTLTAAQASAQTITGAGAGTQGAVIVNALGSAFTNLSLIDVGRATANVPADATLHPATTLGEFAVVLNGVDVDLTLSAAQAHGRAITDTGADGDSVTVTALEATPNADLSAIVVDTETALLDANGGVTLGANLGADMNVIVSDSVAGAPNVVTFTGSMVSATTTFTIASDDITLVFDANNAHDLTVEEAVGGVANSAVIVNNVDGDVMDLSGIVADSMVANVPADAVMDVATDFGGFVVNLAEGADITMTYAQFLAVGATNVLDAVDFSSAAGGVKELVIVTGWDATVLLDTSVVSPSLALVLNVAVTSTVNPLTDLSGVEEVVIPAGVTLTMTADQFEQIQTSATVTGAGTLNITNLDSDNADIDLSTVTAQAGTISLEDDVTEAAGVATTFTLSAALIAGDTISVEIDGVTYSAAFDTNTAQTLANFKDAINASGDLAAVVEGLDVTVRPKDPTADYVIDTPFARTGPGAAVASTSQSVYVVMDAAAILDNATGEKFAVLYTANDQSLTLSSETQADGRTITDSAFTGTVLVLGFTKADATDGNPVIVATDYAVDNVWVLNDYLFNEFGISAVPANFEFFLENLSGSTLVTVYDVNTLLQANLLNPANLILIDRTVTVDQETTIQASVAFNDLGLDAEVRNLTLNLEGNSVITGNLQLPQDKDPQADLNNPDPADDTLPLFFDTLTINSTNEAGLPTAANRITGNIFADNGSDGAGSESLAETFVLTLNPAMSITGNEGQIGFDGRVLALLNGWDDADVASALAGLNYNNYTATDISTPESSTFTVGAMVAGNTLTISGRTVTAIGAATADEVATAFLGGAVAATLAVSGALTTPTGWTGAPIVTAAGAAVTFTNTVNGDATNFTTSTGSNAVVGVATNGASQVEFLNKNVGAVTDVVASDFTFVANNGSTTGLSGTVVTTGQGSFVASENNLYTVVINADHDLVIDGELEMRYVTRSDSADAATVVATIDVFGTGDVTIGSVNTDDIHITGVVLTNHGTGTVTAPGTSPGAALGNTETLTIDVVEVASAVVLGTAGDLNKPGVAGSELSSIVVEGKGDVDLGVIALVDSVDFTLNTDLISDAASVVTADLRADLASTGTWTFDNSAGVGTVALTITGTGVADAYPADATYGASFAAGSNLNFLNIDLIISGVVDFTDVDLSIDAASTLMVAEGGTLTLSLDQIAALDALGLIITGEGTLHVIGEVNTDAFATSTIDLSNVRTVGIDLSDITNAGVIVPQAFLVSIQPNPAGAIGDDGVTPFGYNITGTDFNDDITASGENDTITAGLGDDAINGLFGDNTYNVDAGTDEVTILDTGDVLVVSVGATANAVVTNSFTPDFVATALTINNGTAVLTDDTGFIDDTTMDLSLAGGANGFTLIGEDDDSASIDTLIGSNQDDIINGGNTAQVSANAVDILTGNGGDDTFVFLIDTSDPVVLTPVEEFTVGNDDEIWTITAPFAADVADGSQTLTVVYRNDATVGNFVIVDDATIDFTSIDELGARMASELSSRGLSSSYAAGTGQISVNGSAGQAVEIISVSGAGAFASAEDLTSDDNDVAQQATVTVGDGTLGVVTVAGEIYTLIVTPAYGDAINAEYVADGTESESDLASALAAEFNTLAGAVIPASPVLVVGVLGNLIGLQDQDPDSGGFTLSVSSAGGVAGTGASALGAGAGVWANVFADTIIDFTSGDDLIQLNIADGSNTNYREAAEVASYLAAYNAAEAAFTADAAVRYYLTSIDGSAAGETPTGLLFFDANGDQSSDGVIQLTGVNLSNFDETDIIL